MDWFRRLGLQRRIMLYVAVGLALMFVIGAYVGFLAIRQATELVYQERLGTAFTTATILELNLQDLAHDVKSARSQLLKAASPQDLEEIGSDLLARVSAAEEFPFFHAENLWLIDWGRGTQLAVPASGEAAQMSLPVSTLSTIQELSLLAPLGSSTSTSFGTFAVPVKDASDSLRWTVVLQLAAMHRDEPYIVSLSSSNTTPQGTPEKEALANIYGLEVLGPDGTVALSRKGGTAPGKPSPHWRLLQQEAPETMAPFVFLHKPQKDQKFAPHVIAAVPLTSGPFWVILEQREDVALALPIRLRQRLILFAGLGFVATMLVTWVTTRHVVTPTERLTVAARLIAEGKVETPITVAAQDEIGTLAESLEIMRRRLQAWGSELEKQVRERTAELEERNRDLQTLYHTLQRNDEQLRTLLGKVLSAQEDERRRVSRELHDGIGQALSALTLGLERLAHARPDQWPQLEEHVERLRGVATDTLADLRRLTIALRPAALDDLGLVPAIRRYAELYLGDAGIQFDVQEERLDTRLARPLETVIYRVVQEAINNISRHSDATQATIRLRATEDAVAVTVEDNGKGFDPTLVSSEQGMGLQGMQERASLTGGKLTVDSQPGNGTRVHLEIPLSRRAEGPTDA
ncbi:MAG: HAMP domain-containing protein [Chloroflexi bacterium]|nr:HAMP domain-containing protein [Chloroflexota bacterium]